MLKYLQLEPGSELPDISALKPFRTLVIIEAKLTSEWRSKVSQWLVKSGCLYMLAWGRDCRSWGHSVDFASIADSNFGDIPEQEFVITTSHENDSLRDVCWFSKNIAFHPTVELPSTVILNISRKNRQKEILASYAGA